jgi:hypothetical protein
VTWGTFLHSAIQYVKANVVEGKAQEFGDNTVWLYGAAVVAVSALLPFVGTASRALWTGARRYPLVAGAAFVYVLGHAILDRKAARFVLPALMLWTIVASVGVFAPRRDTETARWHRRWFLTLHALCGLVLSVHYFQRGAVEAARTLDARADFGKRLLLVKTTGQGQVGIGGYYYLDRTDLVVDVVRPEQLAGVLSDFPCSPVYALSEAPLPPDSVPAAWRSESIGAFADWPEFKQRGRRYVYRLQRGP